MQTADITLREGQFHLSGTLNFTTVMSVLEKSRAMFLTPLDKFIFNFADVKSSNSAGLALILEWIQYANEQHKPCAFSHLSSDLLSIAKVAGVDQLIILTD